MIDLEKEYAIEADKMLNWLRKRMKELCTPAEFRFWSEQSLDLPQPGGNVSIDVWSGRDGKGLSVILIVEDGADDDEIRDAVPWLNTWKHALALWKQKQTDLPAHLQAQRIEKRGTSRELNNQIEAHIRAAYLYSTRSRDDESKLAALYQKVCARSILIQVGTKPKRAESIINLALDRMADSKPPFEKDYPPIRADTLKKRIQRSKRGQNP